VLLALHELFPQAPIFTLFFDPKRAHPSFRSLPVKSSFLNHWPLAPKHYEWYLSLMPHAVESFDLSTFDLIISSSASFAKGAIAAPGSLHICYCHTPTRFLWQERFGYVNELPQPRIVKRFLPYLLHRLRIWDRLAADRPDIMLTNSFTSRERIKRYYHRDATVIHPPVDVDRIPLSRTPGTFWLSGGRLVSYKRFDLIVKAFDKLNMPLKIFGRGPEEKKLRALAGEKTEFLGAIDDATKIGLYQNAIGFIHPQVEDFGITAIEAMAAGKPVIAFGKGGITETVIPGVTGEFFSNQCWEDIGNAVVRFKPEKYDPEVIRRHAEKFSKQRFQEEARAFIDQAVAAQKIV
jgi:glycosyltransferase involved in cell wall biosynthesis